MKTEIEENIERIKKERKERVDFLIKKYTDYAQPWEFEKAIKNGKHPYKSVQKHGEVSALIAEVWKMERLDYISDGKAREMVCKIIDDYIQPQE